MFPTQPHLQHSRTITTVKRLARAAQNLVLVASVVAAFASHGRAATSWATSNIYSFDGKSGDYPLGGLVVDKIGNLYGTTADGGNTLACPAQPQYNVPGGCGLIFKLSPPSTSSPKWTETVLHTFSGPDGLGPAASLVIDSNGNLYGTTMQGGGYVSGLGSACPLGCGIVFKLSPPKPGKAAWTETVIHSFSGNLNSVPDGAFPVSPLISDVSGALYGVATGGGAVEECPNNGCGVVFKLSPPKSGQAWNETILYIFADIAGVGSPEGIYPIGSLARDAAGNIYGITLAGGTGAYPQGAVYELSPPDTAGAQWMGTALYSFPQNGIGGYPEYAGLVVDPSRNLYGTVSGGVFELSPPTNGGNLWHESILALTESIPSELKRDKAGNLYGTTSMSGDSNFGTVFKLSHSVKGGGAWDYHVLHSFGYTSTYPSYDSLAMDSLGSLYGATLYGGNVTACPGMSGNSVAKARPPGCGVVFKLTPR